MTTDHDKQASLAPKFPLRLLLVEDNPADAELCLEYLSVAQFELTADVVQTRKEFVDHLQSQSYDIVLADYNLGSWTGMDAFDILQEEGSDIPFILLTAALGDQTAVDCVKRGLADYVLKQRMERLPVAIYRAMEEKAARNERRRSERAIKDAEVRFRALAECARVAVFIEQGGRCTYVNRAAEFVTGFQRRELLEMGFWEMLPEEFRSSVYIEQMLRPNSGESPVRCQAPIVTKAGGERWLDCTAKMVQTESGVEVLIAVAPTPKPSEQKAKSHEAARTEISESASLSMATRELVLAAACA